MFLAGFMGYVFTVEKTSRILVVYTTIALAFGITLVLQLGRLFLTHTQGILFSILKNGLVILGNWSSYGTLALLFALVACIALMTLPLSQKMKYGYGAIMIGSFLFAILVGNVYEWLAMAIACLVLFVTNLKFRLGTKYGFGFLILCVLSVGLFFFTPKQTINSLVTAANPGYTEITLPWRYTT